MHDSPFPGMDPYLEAPTLWSGVQTRLITAIADDLAEHVALHFAVAIEARFFIVADEVRERFIEIRDAASRELVTTIEILSPDNKLAVTTRRVAFLEKRATVMASSAN